MHDICMLKVMGLRNGCRFVVSLILSIGPLKVVFHCRYLQAILGKLAPPLMILRF